MLWAYSPGFISHAYSLPRERLWSLLQTELSATAIFLLYAAAAKVWVLKREIWKSELCLLLSSWLEEVGVSCWTVCPACDLPLGERHTARESQRRHDGYWESKERHLTLQWEKNPQHFWSDLVSDLSVEKADRHWKREWCAQSRVCTCHPM